MRIIQCVPAFGVPAWLQEAELLLHCVVARIIHRPMLDDPFFASLQH